MSQNKAKIYQYFTREDESGKAVCKEEGCGASITVSVVFLILSFNFNFYVSFPLSGIRHLKSTWSGFINQNTRN